MLKLVWEISSIRNSTTDSRIIIILTIIVIDRQRNRYIFKRESVFMHLTKVTDLSS